MKVFDMKQTVLCIAASLLLLGAATGALALNAMTDDQLTRVSGAAGITIAGNVNMLLTATSMTLDLSPEDDHTDRYLRAVDGSDPGDAVFSLDVAVDAMKIEFDLATVPVDATTWTGLRLRVYDWDGDVTPSFDRVETRRATGDATLLGLTVGPARLLPNGTGPSMNMFVAPMNWSARPGAGIGGRLAMKLYIQDIDLAGPSNIINNGTARAHELVFCQNFPDKATKDAYDDPIADVVDPVTYWDYDNWAATGLWNMGMVADSGTVTAKPVTLNVFTTGGNTYLALTVQGNYTREVSYPDSQLSNMGGAGATTTTKNYILGEARLKNMEAIMRNAAGTGWEATPRSIGGLALEDLSMEYTKAIIPTAGVSPYFVDRQYAGGIMPADATALGNTTELPGTVTFFNPGASRTVNWSTTY